MQDADRQTSTGTTVEHDLDPKGCFMSTNGLSVQYCNASSITDQDLHRKSHEASEAYFGLRARAGQSMYDINACASICSMAKRQAFNDRRQWHKSAFLSLHITTTALRIGMPSHRLLAG